MLEREGPHRSKLRRLRRLVIASNRGPLEFTIEDDGSLTSKRGGGGMVTALTAATRFVPAVWIATAMRRTGTSKPKPPTMPM